MKGWLLVWLLIALWTIVVAAGRDFYQILDVPRDAPKSQIKRHYKKLSRLYHPDKNPDNKEAEAKFMELADAYNVLADDEKRSIYDKFGEEGLDHHGQGGGNPFHNPFDVFSHFFGGSHGGRHEQERRGPDMHVRLPVSLADLYNGASIDVDISKQVVCDHCHGSGARRPEDIVTCSACQGQGVRIQRIQLAPGMVQQIQQTCHHCNGKGKTIKHVCQICQGRKVRRASEQYTIIVEKGMTEGQTTVLQEEADEYPDTVPGDIVFTVTTSLHPVFNRQGNNLYTRQYITLIEALTGFSRTLTHLDGSEITLKRQDITPFGFVQTHKGLGMPLHDHPTRHGDLFVEYRVVFPSHVDAKTIELLKQGAHFPDMPDNSKPLLHQEL